MAAPFVQFGGVRVGASYLDARHTSWPFAAISVSEAAIEISAFFWLRRYTFAAGSISRLGTHFVHTYTGLWYRGLCIQHTADECPPFAIFWSPDLEGLSDALEQRGFSVAWREGWRLPPPVSPNHALQRTAVARLPYLARLFSRRR